MKLHQICEQASYRDKNSYKKQTTEKIWNILMAPQNTILFGSLLCKGNNAIISSKTTRKRNGKNIRDRRFHLCTFDDGKLFQVER